MPRSPCGKAAGRLRAGHDARRTREGEPVVMHSTGYAAVWQDGGPVMAGQILVGPGALDFEGAGRGRQASRHIPYTSIVSSRLGRTATERIAGRPALVLELSDGKVIRIATPELGALYELEEAVSSERKWMT